MPPAVAIAGAAVVGAGASLYAGSKAAKAQKQAANAAADASREGTTLQVEEARRQYDTTRGDFTPYREAGYGALSALERLYGLPVTPRGTGEDGGVDWKAYVNSDPWRVSDWKTNYPDKSIEEYGQYNYNYDMQRGRAEDPNYAGIDVSSFQRAPRAAANDTGASDPTAIIAATPGYEFRRSEGLRGIQRSAAARGVLGSGGTLKALQRYGDGLASSEYDAYASRLAALAGVGERATGSTAAAGDSASRTISGAYGTNAANLAGAATAAGNATAAGYANVGSSINTGINNLASAYLYSKSPGFGGGPPGGVYRTGPGGGINN